MRTYISGQVIGGNGHFDGADWVDAKDHNPHENMGASGPQGGSTGGILPTGGDAGGNRRIKTENGDQVKPDGGDQGEGGY